MKEIRSKIDVNDLFNRINELCSIPFSRLEPLSCDLGPTSIASTSIKLPGSILKESTSNGEKRNETKLFKTSTEVEKLFNEIRDFCQIKFPFKLNDLHETDQINLSLTTATQEKPIVSKLKSKRTISRYTKEVCVTKRSSNLSFAKLMFNFDGRAANTNRDNKLSKKPNGHNSRPCPLKRKAGKASLDANPISPLCLSSISLKSSISSCRSYISSVRNNNANKECKTVPKKKVQRKKAIEGLSRDDSLESGYSSSQSSAPSPASTLLSSDLEENQTNRSSMSSNLSTTITDSSLVHNVNPNGEVVYLRSQYDYYLDKTLRPKRKPVVRDNVKCNQRPFDVSAGVDHHQKVIEWQSKTLLTNLCPTPQHNHFDDTPPHSPRQSCDDDSLLVLMDTNLHVQSTSGDDQLDFDCLQDLLDLDIPDEGQQAPNELDLMLSGAYDGLHSTLEDAFPINYDGFPS